MTNLTCSNCFYFNSRPVQEGDIQCAINPAHIGPLGCHEYEPMRKAAWANMLTSAENEPTIEGLLQAFGLPSEMTGSIWDGEVEWWVNLWTPHPLGVRV